MAQMAPSLEVIEYAIFNPCHMTSFHMAPYGTTWRSCAKSGAKGGARPMLFGASQVV